MAPIRLEQNTIDESDELRLRQNGLITISEYIFRRLSQLGIGSVFGVPGDFNLSLLDHIYSVRELNWIGCCNELNAAYAADAYAKASKQMSALLTTFGVGELSAINGVAGAYSEFVPLVHIVGTSSLKEKENSEPKNFHHLVANRKIYEKPNHYIYQNIATNFSVSCASVNTDVESSCDEIDKTLEAIWEQSRPGYIFVPCDLTEMPVNASRLVEKPLQLKYTSKCTSDEVEQISNQILDSIYQSQNVSLLGDVFISKFRMNGVFGKFVNLLKEKVNFFDTPMSKGIIDESLSRFVGTYYGRAGDDRIADAIEASDLILRIGNFDNEINSGFFSARLPKDKTIDVNPQYIRIGNGPLFTNVTMMDVLPRLVSLVDTSKVNNAVRYTNIPKQTVRSIRNRMRAPLTECDVGSSLETLLQPNDILVVETCSFMVAATRLQMNGASILNQCFWGSIGYALPATLGAALALRDFHLPGKVITIEGDGSAQMSIQELGTMLRYSISAILFILNNSGYTIERAIKGPYRSYNDICPNIQWTQLLKTFGDVCERRSRSQIIDNAKSLNSLARSEFFHNDKRLQLVELHLPKFDVPNSDSFV